MGTNAAGMRWSRGEAARGRTVRRTEGGIIPGMGHFSACGGDVSLSTAET